MEAKPNMLIEKLRGYKLYNDWEKEYAAVAPGDDPASRLAWLEEAYLFATRLGALKPWPVDRNGWLAEVEGVRIMHERLALIKENHG